MRYTVEIIETLSIEVETNAETQDEAILEVMDKYYKQEIVLSANDFVDVSFKVWTDKQ